MEGPYREANVTSFNWAFSILLLSGFTLGISLANRWGALGYYVTPVIASITILHALISLIHASPTSSTRKPHMISTPARVLGVSLFVLWAAPLGILTYQWLMIGKASLRTNVLLGEWLLSGAMFLVLGAHMVAIERMKRRLEEPKMPSLGVPAVEPQAMKHVAISKSIQQV